MKYKYLGGVILVLLVFAVLGIYLVSFQVRETQAVVVTRFGRCQRSITEPGLYWKWPVPIERIHRFDSRLQLFEGVMEETTTRSGEPIIVTTYLLWRIDEPQKFLESAATVENVQQKLRGRLRDKQNAVIGRHYFSELVNTDPQKIRFAQIEIEMLEALKEPLRQDYGIGLAAVGIKQLGVNSKVTEDVFARMRADRRRIAEATLAQGKAEATKIRTDAESKKTELLAAAEARAKAIRGTGDAEAAKYYRLLEEDPEFAKFLQDIETVKKALKERATVVITARTRPFELLDRMPQLKPAEPNGLFTGLPAEKANTEPSSDLRLAQ
jgi:membrane protease subunit HflC